MLDRFIYLFVIFCLLIVWYKFERERERKRKGVNVGLRDIICKI